MGTSKTIPVNLEVTASLEGMGKVISELQRGITQGTTKLDLTKGLGASLSKEIASFEKDYARIQKLIAGGVLQLGDTKEFTKKSEHMLSTFEEIQRVIRNLDTLTVLDAKKLFPAAFDERVESLKSTLGGLTDSFDKLAAKNINKSKLESDIAALETSVKELNELASKETEYRLSSTQAQKRLDEANQKVEELRSKLKQEIELKISTNSTAIQTAEQEIEKILKKQKKRESTKDIVDKPGQKVKYKGKTAAQWEKSTKDSAQQRNAALKVLATYEAEKKAIAELQEQLRQLAAEREKLAGASQKTDTKLSKAAQDSGSADVKAVTDALEEQKKAAEDAETAAKNLAKAQEAVGKAGAKQEELTQKQERLKKVMGEIEALSKKVNFDSINKAFSDLNTALTAAGKDGLNLDLTPDMLKSEEGIKKIRAALDKLDAEDLDKLKSELRELGLNADKTKDNVEGLKNGVEGVGDTAKTMNAAQRDMERLKDSMMQFFSLSNTIQLFKRTIRDAFNTVKELDAAMTETAVVTDFSVGDMWDKLPEYSDEANKLGASIKDLYNATTLYYQQGLKGAEVMDVGVETMKMARIAGMDAAAATEAMTAALRGFNMEINEMSATRINDVYSELAAITAADTSQIATAMTKTASIAASANMEFETTAALLAQIIETTQEAPETAGTAMKTIIARFTEVKELFDEGMLTGEDAEGEEININKIDAALKTVGISLKDFLNGSKGIDDIFLELASKWNTLDLATQRYIATTAAGSRQQSRFLAMMSNYDRTMELVTAANNSAGASQKQFDKTTESLAAKLQRLKNAWDTFVMGLANSEAIKMGVDLLTSFLNKINELTDMGDSKLGKFATTIARLGTVLIGLKTGQGILNGFLKFLGNTGIDKIFGLNMEDVGKIDFLAAIKKAIAGLGESATKTKNSIVTLLNNLKDPAWRGDMIKSLGASLKGAGKAVLGFLKTWGIWIALLVGVIALIKQVIKIHNEAQKSFKMQGLQESMQSLAEESEAAKDELNEIANSRKNLENMENTLSELTKGTDEWKRSLIAVNQEVLRLIEQYPELGGFVTTGSNGQLSISDAGWNKIYDDQLQLITNISGLQNVTTAQIKELQQGMDFDNFIIEIQETEANKKMTEIELALADTFDSTVGKTNITVGDMVAAANDGFTAADNPMGKAGYQLGVWLAEKLFGATAPKTNAQFNQEIKENGGYAVDTQRSKTGGLTQKEYTALAAAFAEEGITMSDGLTNKERANAEAIYSEFGYDTDFADSIINAAEKLGTSFDELGSKVLSLTLQEEQAAKNFVRNAVSSADEIAGLEYGDAITEFLTGVKNYEDLTAEIDKEKQQILSESPTSAELMQQYATMYGKYYADGKLYTDSSMSTQIEGLSDDYLANAIASANITIQVKQDALQIAQSGLKGKDIELFDNLFSASGSEITSKQVTKYSQEDGYNFNQIAIDMGFANLEDMATQLETTVEDLTETLTENFESATDRIAKQRRDLTKQMSKYSSKDLQGYEVNAAILSALEMKFGEQIRYTLENVISSLEVSGDQALISKGYEQFRNVAMTGNKEDVQKLYSFIEDIDWSNPIDAVYTLNQEIQKGSGLTADYAKGMMEIESSFFGAGNQMQYFLKSNDFKEMQEDLTEIVDLNGELTASDVLSLADDYKSLNKILKNTEATAGGVAKALQLVAEGKLGIYQLTDAVMASLEGFDSLDSLIAETLKTLEEFDPGPNENEVADFINTAYETISENLKAGAVGNTQNFSYLDFLFPGWRDGKEGDELVAQMEYLTGKLEDNAVNMRRSWTDIYNKKDIYGNEIQFDEGSGRTYEDLSVQDTGSEILLTGWEGKGMTTNDIVDWIADAYEVSDDYARMMLADFKNYSADLAVELNANDYAASIGNAYEELNTIKVDDVNARAAVDKKIIDESEIQAIATLYQQEFDDVYAYFDERGAVITDFYDENGMLEETAVIMAELDKISQSGGAEGAQWVKQFIDASTSNLNIDKLNEGLGNVGIPEEAKARITQDIIDSMMAASGAESMMVDVTLSDGSTTALEITPNINLETAIANAETELANSKLADSIVSAFSNVTISPQVDTENMTGYVISAIKAADGTTVVIAPDQESLNTITSSVTGAAQAAKPYVHVNSNINSIISSINSINRTVTVTVKYQEVGKPSGTSGNGGNAADPDFFVNNAVGVKNARSSYDALVSEEGPELIQTKDGAYLTGQNGPEFAHINKGDTVYTAEETAQILKNRKHTLIPRYASGYGYGEAYLGKGSGGRSSDSDEETWENPFDKLYSLVRKIDEELRQRERIERRYEKLLDSIDASASKIVSVSREELAQLEKERMLQEALVAGRRSQISQYQSENADLSAYANVVQNERGESVLRINWDLINQVTDPDKGARIEEYVSQMEEWFDSLEQAEDALWDIEDAVEEIKERGKEEYLDLEDTIKEALAQSYQDEIDKLSQINDSINDTNSSLLDAIQKSIDKQRQDRDNQRTENDLAEKQRRLLYLQQDTSGANAMEIMQLQKELEEGQEDYTDTLIDQKISELQEQNDEASKQREQQITLLQSQLDHYIKSGQIWQDVYSLMDTGLDEDTGLIRGSKLEEILKDSANFAGMSEIAKMEWMKDTNNMIAQALAYLEIGRQLEDIGVQEGTNIEFTTSDGRILTGTVNADGSVTASDGQTYNNVFQGYDGKYYAGENIDDVEEPEVESPSGGQGGGEESKPKTKNNPYGVASNQGNYTARNGTMWSSGVKAIQWALNDMGYNAGTIDGGYGYTTAQAVSRFQRAEGISADGDYGPQTREKMKLRGYKTGGLADFTGPAWLDGTKARPELVLSSRDTENFIQLKDILSSIMSRGNTSNSSTENNGDITYDIDINVESIGSDYDVEQVANKVKSLIGENARYRNNNTVSLAR